MQNSSSARPVNVGLGREPKTAIDGMPSAACREHMCEFPGPLLRRMMYSACWASCSCENDWKDYCDQSWVAVAETG